METQELSLKDWTWERMTGEEGKGEEKVIECQELEMRRPTVALV